MEFKVCKTHQTKMAHFLADIDNAITNIEYGSLSIYWFDIVSFCLLPLSYESYANSCLSTAHKDWRLSCKWDLITHPPYSHKDRAHCLCTVLCDPTSWTQYISNHHLLLFTALTYQNTGLMHSLFYKWSMPSLVPGLCLHGCFYCGCLSYYYYSLSSSQSPLLSVLPSLLICKDVNLYSASSVRLPWPSSDTVYTA